MKNSMTTTEHMDSNRSVSPATTWNSRKTNALPSREIDLAHGRADGKLNQFPISTHACHNLKSISILHSSFVHFEQPYNFRYDFVQCSMKNVQIYEFYIQQWIFSQYSPGFIWNSCIFAFSPCWFMVEMRLVCSSVSI